MRDDLMKLMKDNIVTVKFLKKDGTERVMNATLREDIIPQATKEDPLSQKKVRVINEEVIPCWDCDKDGWRSFRVDSVISFNTLQE